MSRERALAIKVTAGRYFIIRIEDGAFKSDIDLLGRVVHSAYSVWWNDYWIVRKRLLSRVPSARYLSSLNLVYRLSRERSPLFPFFLRKVFVGIYSEPRVLLECLDSDYPDERKLLIEVKTRCDYITANEALSVSYPNTKMPPEIISVSELGASAALWCDPEFRVLRIYGEDNIVSSFVREFLGVYS